MKTKQTTSIFLSRAFLARKDIGGKRTFEELAMQVSRIPFGRSQWFVLLCFREFTLVVLYLVRFYFYTGTVIIYRYFYILNTISEVYLDIVLNIGKASLTDIRT